MKRSASFTLRCTSAPCENSLKLGILFKKTNVRVPHVRPTGRICSGIDTYSKIDTSGSSHYCTCTRTVRRYERTIVLPYESTKVLSYESTFESTFVLPVRTTCISTFVRSSDIRKYFESTKRLSSNPSGLNM